MSAALLNATKIKPFNWTKRTEAAAMAVAEDEQTDEQIAAAAGVHKTTLEAWKRHPDFAARVAGHIDAMRADITAAGIARWDKRIEGYTDRWRRMKQVIEERAKNMALYSELDPAAAGSQTGLIVRKETALGRIEYTVDTALMAAMLALEKQAAQELGQWVDRGETTHRGGMAIAAGVKLENLNEQELAALETLLSKAGGIG